ncbi:protein involved in polysaccharide export with SLBB domain [Pseudodesulfovibrio indicus]|uniref:Protein involved in polysaccharide export with SLBB domain n=1 Tax=Pseudodesulfovibrio indicus TaxID=1716143 RepID=A0AA94TR79_9BACT|nr:protein involved in polysaccharide export with SLBB domain [Pseudodesulfovibrio indicus]
MRCFSLLALLLVLLLPVNGLAQDTHQGLFLPNSDSLQINNMTMGQQDGNAEGGDAEPNYPTYTPPKPFSGVETKTTMGGIEAEKSHRTLHQRFNVMMPTGQDPAYGNTDARHPFETVPFPELPVYGQSLFSGHFSSTYYDERNPSYLIRYGDRIGVRIWGAFNFEQELTVDLLGNIFIPTVGPIKVMGVPNGSLAKVVMKAVENVYQREYIKSYIDLLTPNPLSVFVSGQVLRPGRYAGGSTDSILYFLDLAGGIDSFRGSYRDISIMRKGKEVANIDLYDFIRDGKLSPVKLEEGDVIVVKERGIKVGVNGQVRFQAWFEFNDRYAMGSDIMDCSLPMAGVTHVSLQGYRNREPFKKYLTLDEFKYAKVMDEDTVEFLSDSPAEMIVVYVEGAIAGRSQFFVKRGTRLHALLNYIAVDKTYAKLDSIYLKRISVAEQQAAALADSLFRLQQNSLIANSQTAGEAEIRIKEAALIDDFVKRAANAEQKGVVAIANKGKVEDVFLQDGDIVVIPRVTDVVLITGQVLAPNTVVYNKDYQLEDYLKLAGGLELSSDENHILIFKSNGFVEQVADASIEPGDTIMALPVYRSKNLEFAKALTQIFYQIAVGTRAILQTAF